MHAYHAKYAFIASLLGPTSIGQNENRKYVQNMCSLPLFLDALFALAEDCQAEPNSKL